MEPYELVQALKAMGLTQKQIAERTGIPQPSISKIERGEVADVMSRNYRALVAAYEQEVRTSKGEAPALPVQDPIEHVATQPAGEKA